MNLRTKTRGTLVIIARAAAGAIAGGKVTGFTPEQNLAISTAIFAKADSLNAANEKVMSTRAAAQSATAVASGEQIELIELLGTTKYSMRGVNANSSEYESVEFKAPAPASRVTPQRPTSMSATGYSNGVNKLKFTGANEPGSVNYVLEANRGGGTGWFIIGMTGKQSFIHDNVIPGEAYQYRVRAQASSGRSSSWSGIASVYGPVPK
jgi:hypothetical protein